MTLQWFHAHNATVRFKDGSYFNYTSSRSVTWKKGNPVSLGLWFFCFCFGHLWEVWGLLLAEPLIQSFYTGHPESLTLAFSSPEGETGSSTGQHCQLTLKQFNQSMRESYTALEEQKDSIKTAQIIPEEVVDLSATFVWCIITFPGFRH